MALITTVGGSTTNSYVTIDEAEAYLELAGYTYTEFEGLDDGPKELRLTTAALLLNTLPLRGFKACRDQRLEFPRWWRTDEGFPVTEDQYLAYSEIAAAGYAPPTVPSEIQQAQIEVAFHYVHGGIMQLDSMAYPEREIKSFTLGGSLEIEFSEVLNKQSSFSKGRISSLDVAYSLLQKWIRTISGGVV